MTLPPDSHLIHDQTTEATSVSRHGVVPAAGAKLSREDEAKLALGHTDISPRLAWILVFLLLLTLLAVPITQSWLEIKRNRAEKRESIAPQSWNFWRLLPSREEVQVVRSPSDFEKLLPPVAEIKDYETALEEESLVSQWLLPRAQYLLTRWLGVGNEQVYLGRSRWLHYRPDVDYVTSPGFLDPALLLARQRSGDEGDALVQPDPMRAIVDFQQQLQARNITLIVMPMPVKTMIEPEQLSSRYTSTRVLLQNPSQNKFLDALKARGVLVFDPAPLLIKAKRETDRSQYLRTDTHWTSPAMELVAQELAAWIEGRVLPPSQGPEYRRQQLQIQNSGDIAAMLTLLENRPLFQPQTVTIQPVQTPDGKPWRPTTDAEILLLGDSFCNIYSMPGMGWGRNAGFGPQLSFHLRRPLDTIIINAGGSHTSRQRLVSDLARGRDRLKNTRLVIWQFAVRDLLIGDWKIFTLPPTNQAAADEPA